MQVNPAMEVSLKYTFANGTYRKAVAVIYRNNNSFSVTAAPKGDLDTSHYVNFVSTNQNYVPVFNEICVKLFKEECLSLEYNMKYLD